MTDASAVLRLAALFQGVAETRMADLPLRNPALQVEAVGFRPWQGASVGVLITPWCMNLICLPGPASSWDTLRPGMEVTLPFPSGDYVFRVAREATLGPYLTGSLFSPMFGLSGMGEARAVAESVMAEVFPEAAASPRGSTARHPDTRPQVALNRRGFLAAWLPRG